MRRIFYSFTCIIFTLMLCSCGSTGGKIEPIKTETVDFDINKATQMIKKGEKIIADISIKDTVSRQEYKQFLNDMSDAYDGYEEVKWENMFFYNEEIENEQIGTLHLKKNMFYPTIYHKDVDVVSAKIKNTYYQDEFFNEIILTLREEYLGDDSKLDGWYREYLYKKNDDDKWVFYAFGGEMNFSGESFTSDFLKLK